MASNVTPWKGSPAREDKILLAAFAASAIVPYAAVGDGGMRLRVFLVLDALGTVLWTTLLAFAGWELGQRAVDVADLVARYGLWATIGLVVLITLWRSFRIRRRRRP